MQLAALANNSKFIIDDFPKHYCNFKVEFVD